MKRKRKKRRCHSPAAEASAASVHAAASSPLAAPAAVGAVQQGASRAADLALFLAEKRQC